MRSRDLLFRTDLPKYNSNQAKNSYEINIKIRLKKNVWCGIIALTKEACLAGVVIPEVFDTLTHFEPTF